MWRKAITASTTFCQLRSSIFDLHLVNHVLSITLPACWELRYLCSNFSIRIAGDQRPCHVGGRRARKPVSRPSSGDCDRRAPSVHRRGAKSLSSSSQYVVQRGFSLSPRSRHVRGLDVLPNLPASRLNRAPDRVATGRI